MPQETRPKSLLIKKEAPRTARCGAFSFLPQENADTGCMPNPARFHTLDHRQPRVSQ